jgi:hypothetical protein
MRTAERARGLRQRHTTTRCRWGKARFRVTKPYAKRSTRAPRVHLGARDTDCGGAQARPARSRCAASDASGSPGNSTVSFRRGCRRDGLQPVCDQSDAGTQLGVSMAGYLGRSRHSRRTSGGDRSLVLSARDAGRAPETSRRWARSNRPGSYASSNHAEMSAASLTEGDTGSRRPPAHRQRSRAASWPGRSPEQRAGR